MQSYKPGEIMKSVDQKSVRKYSKKCKNHLKDIQVSHPKWNAEEVLQN